MDNEVVIHVRAENDVSRGYAAARRETESFGKKATETLASAGMSGGGAFAKSLSGSLAGASSSIGPVLGGVAVAAAPFIASAISGAVIGGAGIGGVVGGLMIAAKDPRVAGAMNSLKSDFQDRLTGAAESFIQPAVNGIGIIRHALDSIDVERIFAKSAQFVEPLARGVAAAMEGLGNGIEDLVDNAGPAVDAIARGIGDIGQSIGEGLSSLSDNGESAAETLDDIFMGISNIVDITFNLINGLTEANEKLQEWGIDPAVAIKLLNRAFDEGEESVGQWVDGVDDGKKALRDFQDALHDVNDDLRAQTDPVFKLMDAQDDLTTAQENYNKSLKENGKHSPETERALRRLADAGLDVQGAVADLGDEFNGNLTPELRNTMRAAGLTDTQIDRLGSQFRDAKKDGDRFAKKYQATVALAGYRGANGQLNGLLRDLEHFDGRWTATMITNYVRHGKPGTGGGLASGGIKGAADGGMNGGLTWTGEHGPELLDLPPGTRVHSNPDSMRMASQGGGGGPLSITVRAEPRASRDLVSVILESLRMEVRAQGGNVQQVLGVAGR